VEKFSPDEVKTIYKPPNGSSGEDNGQVTIIGGSSLFQGAPLLALTAASRIVDMVFFASPFEPMREITAYLKANLHSFIWVPWGEVEKYVEKSDAVLIGPGMMRYSGEGDRPENLENCDEACLLTRSTTEHLLKKFPQKKWVIDAGSLQTMEASWIPPQAILTPNKKEYSMLFGEKDIANAAAEYHCILVKKGPVTLVCSPEKCVEVHGGNPGLTKGGSGDVMAGLTVALLAKNDPFLAAKVAAHVVKAAGDRLSIDVGNYYNADDVADQVSRTLATLAK